MAPGPVELQLTSRPRRPPAEVFAVAETTQGVDAELAPLVRMTHPHGVSSLRRERPPAGEVLFRSWSPAFGVIPFDRHALRLERVVELRSRSG